MIFAQISTYDDLINEHSLVVDGKVSLRSGIK